MGIPTGAVQDSSSHHVIQSSQRWGGPKHTKQLQAHPFEEESCSAVLLRQNCSCLEQPCLRYKGSTVVWSFQDSCSEAITATARIAPPRGVIPSRGSATIRQKQKQKIIIIISDHSPKAFASHKTLWRQAYVKLVSAGHFPCHVLTMFERSGIKSDKVSRIKPARMGHFQYYVKHALRGPHFWRTLSEVTHSLTHSLMSSLIQLFGPDSLTELSRPTNFHVICSAEEFAELARYNGIYKWNGFWRIAGSVTMEQHKINRFLTEFAGITQFSCRLEALSTEFAILFQKKLHGIWYQDSKLYWICRIFSIFAIFCWYVTEFAGNWVDLEILQKMLQEFVFSQKVPKNNTELAKR